MTNKEFKLALFIRGWNYTPREKYFYDYWKKGIYHIFYNVLTFQWIYGNVNTLNPQFTFSSKRELLKQLDKTENE